MKGERDMVIMLSKGPSKWALQGGNDVRILQPILEHICKGVEEEDEDSLNRWCQFADEKAKEVFPSLSWNASDVFFFFIPNERSIQKIFLGVDDVEHCAYWMKNSEITSFFIAEEISIFDIPKHR